MPYLSRRLLLAAPALLALPAHAQPAWPNRPIRMMVGSASGGSADFTARLLANRLGELLGQSVVVENRGGAGGSLAIEPVLRAAPDGHTLVINNMGALLINPLIQNQSPAQQPMEALEPVSLVADVLTVLVTPAERPWRDFPALVAAAREKPGALSWGHPSVGSSPWLAALLLNQVAGIRTIGVPYRGGGPAMLDMLAGRLDFMFATTPTCFPHIQSGKLRALAVPVPQRLPQLPEVPSVAESGFPGFEVRGWFAVMATKGTPAPIIRRLNAAINQVMAEPEAAAKLAEQGMAPLQSSTEEFIRIARAEREKWGPIAMLANRGQE